MTNSTTTAQIGAYQASRNPEITWRYGAAHKVQRAFPFRLPVDMGEYLEPLSRPCSRC